LLPYSEKHARKGVWRYDLISKIFLPFYFSVLSLVVVVGVLISENMDKTLETMLDYISKHLGGLQKYFITS